MYSPDTGDMNKGIWNNVTCSCADISKNCNILVRFMAPPFDNSFSYQLLLKFGIQCPVLLGRVEKLIKTDTCYL